jgi:RNA polymerase sigma-70 factor, ECF subfamily
MDRGLVLRAQTGDHDAFTRLAAASLGHLNSVARLILHDPHDADDAVQDALVGAWRNIRSLHDPDRFSAWLNRLLVRSCYDRARRERRNQITEIRMAAGLEETTPDRQRSLAIRDQLERGLRRLPIEQRSALVLTYYVDLPLAESATALGIPIGTLKSRLHRSLDALRAIVDADDRESASGKESLA